MVDSERCGVCGAMQCSECGGPVWGWDDSGLTPGGAHAVAIDSNERIVELTWKSDTEVFGPRSMGPVPIPKSWPTEPVRVKDFSDWFGRLRVTRRKYRELRTAIDKGKIRYINLGQYSNRYSGRAVVNEVESPLSSEDGCDFIIGFVGIGPLKICG